MNRAEIKKMVVAAALVAIGVFLPTIFHMVGFSYVLSPMHIPVLLCGLICGWKYGLAAGLLTPVLSSLFTGMPPFPAAVYMPFELAAYGVIGGLLARRTNVVVALVVAMIGGRVVLGIAQFVMFGLLGVAGRSFVMIPFLMSNFVTAWPALVLHIIAVPAIIYALRAAKLIPLEPAHA